MNAVNGATIRNLAQLAHAELVNAPSEDMTVTSISLDSSAVEPGGIFAALPGTRAHGASYAKDSKASALLTDADGSPSSAPPRTHAQCLSLTTFALCWGRWLLRCTGGRRQA